MFLFLDIIHLVKVMSDIYSDPIYSSKKKIYSHLDHKTERETKFSTQYSFSTLMLSTTALLL